MTNKRVDFNVVCALIMSMMFIVVSYAQDGARHINFTTPIMTLENKPMVQGSEKDSPPLTVGDIAVMALFASLDEDKQKSAIDKGPWAIKLWDLSKKIYKNKNAVLTVEEISIVRTRILEIQAMIPQSWVLIVAQSLKVLDNAESKK